MKMKTMLLSWVQTSAHSSNLAMAATNVIPGDIKNSSNMNVAMMRLLRNEPFFGESQRDSPFMFGLLIDPYGGI